MVRYSPGRQIINAKPMNTERVIAEEIGEQMKQQMKGQPVPDRRF